MSATSIAESAASFSSMPTPAFSQMVSVKLNQENYLLWAAQVLPYLRRQGLSGHIDGSIAMPRQTIAAASAEDSDGRTIVVNPNYTSWYHQDQLVLSVINSSLFEEVLSTVVDATTARHAWSACMRQAPAHVSCRYGCNSPLSRRVISLLLSTLER
jgi:hypothetical protein